MRSIEIPIILLIAFILDLLLGDPSWLPHPVVWIGKLIRWLERILKPNSGSSNTRDILKGIILLVVVTSVSTLVPLAILLLMDRFSHLLRLIIETIWCWQLIAMGSMAEEAQGVYKAVSKADLPRARSRVAGIVGRDTKDLSLTDVIKACVETVAESTSDGIIAPMFYMLILGAPLGFCYKSVNTLDSMVGYRNDRYINFGKASARMDDILNLIPSRLTALMMIINASLCHLDGKNAFAIWQRDHSKHDSPNSGNPESAMAGALHIQLGGDAYYFGKLYHKEYLGDPDREPEPQDIKNATRLMWYTSLFALVLGMLIRMAIYLI